MTDCLQAGYSITIQSVIAVFFSYLWLRPKIYYKPGLQLEGKKTELTINTKRI